MRCRRGRGPGNRGLRLALGACLALLGTARAEDDADALRGLCERLFAAVAAKDADAAMALWSAESQQRDAFAASVALGCESPSDTPPEELALSDVVVKGDTASATLRFRGHWTKDEEFEDEPVTIWHVAFRREAGAWRWWSQEHAAVGLARALAGAPTASERAQLLESNRELLTLRLVTTLTAEGNSRLEAGEPAEAMRRFDAACETARLLDRDDLIAYSLLFRGKALIRAGGGTEAVAQLEEALERASRHGSAYLEGGVRSNLGLALLEEGRLREAEEQITAAIGLADSEGTLAVFENNLGLVRGRAGDKQGAMKWYEASLARARRLGRADLAAEPLNNLGTILWDRGDFGGALKAYLEARDIVAEGDASFAMRLCNNIGLVYLDARETEKALENFEASRALAVRTGSRNDEAVALNHMALARLALGKAPDAARDLEASLALAGNDRRLAGIVRNNLGFARREAGDPEGALRLYEASLAEAEGADRIVTLCNIGEVLYRKSDAAGAARRFSEALGLAQAVGATGQLFLCHHGLGLALDLAGERDLALAQYALASACIEYTRESLPSGALRQSFLSSHTAVYDHAADALLALGRNAEAFGETEKKKARALADVLASADMTVTKAMNDRERQEEARLAAAASEIARQLDSATKTDERRMLKARIKQARSALEDFRVATCLRYPDLATLRVRFDSATPADLDRTLFARDPLACILSYQVIGDRVAIFLLRPGAEIAVCVRESKVPLDARVRQLWSQCASAKGQPSPEARALYDLLVAPVESALKDASHLIIIPDGILHALPFQALEDATGRRVIEKWAVSYAPSATALVKMVEIGDRQRAARDPELAAMLAIGAPIMPKGFGNLPDARKEVEAVAEGFHVPAVVGEDATEARAKAAMAKARRIHIATHAELNEASPMYSYIVLAKDAADDGCLHAREIADLDLHAELAVLSACQTARGKQVEGEGVVGLTWALLVAGVPSTVVSQWQVADKATGALMTAFYARLAKGDSKAEALRQAQLSLLKDGEHGHPYYWAPFILVGDWN